MARQKPGTPADKHLGSRIAFLRRKRQLSPMQLGRKINATAQQIERYESGMDRVPVPVLENIGEAMDCRVPKRLIRRIVFFRKLEAETKLEQEELMGFYSEVFDDENYDDEDDED